MGAGAYLLGVLWLALMAGPIAAAAAFALRRALAHLRGPARAVGFGLVFTGGLMAAMLLPGVLGILTRGTAVASSWIVAAGIARLTRRWPREPAAAEPARPASGPLLWALAGVAVLAAGAYLLSFAADRYDEPITHIDALSFGLPGVVEWIQRGTMWPVPHFVPLWAFGNYPNNGELLQLAAILPWHGLQLVRPLGLAYLLFAGGATYGLAIELGAARAAAAAWAAGSMVIPATLLPAAEWAKTDVVMLACFVSGVMFLVRHARTRERSDLLLGALGLGIAFGTKWYGVAYVPLILAGWAVLRARGAGRRIAGRELVGCIAVVGLAGGFWLLRNLVESSNPVFPVRVAPFGVTIFEAPFDVERHRFGFALLHYATNLDVIRVFVVPAFRHAYALIGALCALAVVVTAAGRVLRGARAVPGAVAAVALGSIAIWLVYAATPYTAQGPEGRPEFIVANVRYAAPAIALGAAVGAWWTARLRRLAPLVLALVAAGTLHAVREIAPEGVDASLRPIGSGRHLVLYAAVAAILAGAVILRPRVLRGARAAVAVVSAIVIAGGYLQAHRFFASRAYSEDPLVGWVLAHAGSGHRIGVVGPGRGPTLVPTLPLAGPRLGNHVAWLGPVVRGFMHDVPDRETFDAELARDDDDLVYVFRDPGKGDGAESWAAAAGLRPITRTPFATLYARPAKDG